MGVSASGGAVVGGGGRGDRGGPAGAGVEGCLPTLQAAMADFVPGKTSRLEAVRKAFETRGCKPEWLALFDSHESFFSAFPNETFGRAEYRWDDETRPIEAVLSVVDCLVTLVEEEGVPACLAWDPIARVREPTGWQAGGVHRPEVVERCQRLPGCSKACSLVGAGAFLGPASAPDPDDSQAQRAVLAAT